MLPSAENALMNSFLTLASFIFSRAMRIFSALARLAASSCSQLLVILIAVGNRASTTNIKTHRKSDPILDYLPYEETSRLMRIL